MYFRLDWRLTNYGRYELSQGCRALGEACAELDAAGFYTSKLLRPYLVESAGPGLVAEYGSNPEFAVDAFVDHVLKTEKPIKSILPICCGFGAVERRFMQKLPGVEICIGLDLSEGALKFAREQAAAEGLAIAYESVDLNSYTWPEGKFDLVVANGALDHIDDLEGAHGGDQAGDDAGWLAILLRIRRRIADEAFEPPAGLSTRALFLSLPSCAPESRSR